MIFDDIKNIHFVGIGGIGMSAIAEVLAEGAATVSGCDLQESAATELLARRGIPVTIGHDASHVEGKDLVVVTSAIRGRNAEVDAARSKGIRIMRRAEVLGAIVDQHRGICIAGTHGKTTTSAMISIVLQQAGLDPTIVVGGMLRNLATNAKRGTGELLVAEADEYDRTFHELHPQIAVVTNIEPDHLEYYKTFDAILEAFRTFLAGVKPGGTIVACADDPGVARLLGVRPSLFGLGSEERRPDPQSEERRSDPNSGIRFVSYGLGKGAEVRAVNVRFTEGGSSFEVPGLGGFELRVPGEHNVRNALAAIAVGGVVGIEPASIASGLAGFLGVERRFQVLGDYLGAVVVDDYAHHPTEIRATLAAARQGYPGRRLVALFQPHLYTRTRDFARELAEALGEADVAIVAPVYAAREVPVEGVSARMIADAAPGIEFLDRSNPLIALEMRRRLGPNDVFITMGAGDVHEVAEELVRGEGG